MALVASRRLLSVALRHPRAAVVAQASTLLRSPPATTKSADTLADVAANIDVIELLCTQVCQLEGTHRGGAVPHHAWVHAHPHEVGPHPGTSWSCTWHMQP